MEMLFIRGKVEKLEYHKSFKYRFKQVSSLLCLLPLMFMYQNCSEHEKEVKLYASPFASQKIQIKNFELSPEKAGGISKVEVDVIVNNQCAYQLCEDQSSAVSCQLYKKSMDPRMRNLDQHYVHTMPKGIKHADLNEYFQGYEADRECIVGVANIYNYQGVTNDTHYSNQSSYMNIIRYNEAQTYFNTSDLDTVRVAIIDSGVGVSPDLQVVSVKEDMRTEAQKTMSCPSVYSANSPQHFHGSFVAGIIASPTGNSEGIAGIAPNAELYSYTAADCNGVYKNVSVANSIILAVSNHDVEVINMSIGGQMPDDVGLRSAIVQAMNNKVMIIASAGNSNLEIGPTAASYYPAMYAVDYTGVISVGALVNANTRASFSNYSGGDAVTITAPGVGIVSTNGTAHTKTGVILSGDYGVSDGTSFSAPLVTGAVVLALGRLKNLDYVYDLAFVKSLVTDTGAKKTTSLEAVAKNGASLDLEKLGEVLNGLATGGVSTSMTAVSRLVPDGDGFRLEVDVDWDLIAAHPGARIAIFDSGSTCNFTKPCILQDFELDALQGSQTFVLNKNEITTLVPDVRDPNFRLFLTVAIYYPVPNSVDEDTGEVINYKNNYGIDSSVAVDLRSLDNSDGASALKGQITNFRKDMQNLYIQGWACYEGDNAAVDVEIADYQTKQVIQSKYSYIYPYMIPHGTPIDSNPYWPMTESDFDLAGRVETPYIANGIDIFFNHQNTHKAGLETNPQIIEQCNTLTAAHGFEFVLPLSEVQALNEKQVEIVARRGGDSLRLQNIDLEDNITLPQIIDIESTLSSLSIQRNPASFTVTGELCADSPAPVEVEVSFTYEDFRLALLGHTTPGENTSFAGFAHDVGYDHVIGQSIYTIGKATNSDNAQIRRSTSASLWGSKFLEYFNSLTNYQPNVYLTAIPNAAYMANVNARDIRQLGTGLPITAYSVDDEVYAFGSQMTADSDQNKTYVESVAAGNKESSAVYWDYYDVGAPFSSTLVGYPVDLTTPIGQWIDTTYGVKTLLREVKKFETPLKTHAQVLKYAHLNVNSRCGPRYRHQLSTNINNYVNYIPKVKTFARGHWLDSETQPSADTMLSAQAAMQRVPLTLRFFQDGALIKHVVTDFSDGVTSVTYPF